MECYSHTINSNFVVHPVDYLRMDLSTLTLACCGMYVGVNTLPFLKPSPSHRFVIVLLVYALKIKQTISDNLANVFNPDMKLQHTLVGV